MYLYLIGHDLHLLQEWQAAHLVIMGADVWNSSTALGVEPTEIIDNHEQYLALVAKYANK